MNVLKKIMLILKESILLKDKGQELYRKGNSKEEFYNILSKNMRLVYDSARRQGYEIWERV